MTHWNSELFYPVVGVWLIIDTPEGEFRVKRPERYVSHSEPMIYLTEKGAEIKGRYRWQYA
jgi:hypothetical protein